MLSKIMPYLWRFNNWVDKKVLHITAWLRTVTDEKDVPYDEPDIIEMLWRVRCEK